MVRTLIINSMKTLTKAKTHIEKVRQTDKSATEEVCALIGWSVDYYCEFQFCKYLEFIDRMFEGCPPSMVNQVKYSKVFRGFWNNEAALRNQTEFLPFAKYEPVNSENLLPEFEFTHNPISLMHDDLFMMKYNNVLQIIRKEEVCN